MTLNRNAFLRQLVAIGNNDFLLLRLIFFLLFGGMVQLSFGQLSDGSIELSGAKLVHCRPMEIISNPEKFLNSWFEEPVSLALYSNEEILRQKEINRNVSDGVVVYEAENEEVGKATAIDQIEITPYTWRWVQLKMINGHSDSTTILLRRPNVWIKKIEADKIGNTVYVNLPEMGVQGRATVTDLYANRLDTRVWDEQFEGHTCRPITGKFIHENSKVVDLIFSSLDKPLGVTPHHAFWSMDRMGWVPAKDLEMGERIKTFSGELVLQKRLPRPGVHKVYNIEVYKDHNYHVSLKSILVHNACWDDAWGSLWDKFTSDVNLFSRGHLTQRVGKNQRVIAIVSDNETIRRTQQRIKGFIADAIRAGREKITINFDVGFYMGKEEMKRMHEFAQKNNLKIELHDQDLPGGNEGTFLEVTKELKFIN